MSILKRLSLLVAICWSGFATATSGVAFIHGTGHQTKALDDYWTKSFVDSVMQGHDNQNMYTVINCDLDQFMWNSGASGCVASQQTLRQLSYSLSSLNVNGSGSPL